MNLFILDSDPVRAAQAHHDVHVNKMATETGQLLTAALAHLKGSYDLVPAARRGQWKKVWRKPIPDGWGVSHPYHPATKWLLESSGNCRWAFQLGVGLCDEWHHRTGKVHASFEKTLAAYTQIYLRRNLFPAEELTEFVIAFNHQTYADCILPDVIESYREYYRRHKVVLPKKGPAKWTNREPPSWLNPRK